MKIREGKLEGFKRQVQVRWFLNSDNTECEIREAYESSALLAHTANVREALGILFEQYATGHFVVIYGDPSTIDLPISKQQRKGKELTVDGVKNIIYK